MGPDVSKSIGEDRASPCGLKILLESGPNLGIGLGLRQQLLRSLLAHFHFGKAPRTFAIERFTLLRQPRLMTLAFRGDLFLVLVPFPNQCALMVQLIEERAGLGAAAQ
jgi:hypothetical protein